MRRLNEETLRDFCKRHSIEIVSESISEKGKVLRLKGCVFDDSHTDSGKLIISAKGSCSYKCNHDSCQDKTLADFIKKYEPDFYKDGAAVKSGKQQSHIVEDIVLPRVEETAEAEVDWLIERYIPKDTITILCGDGGVGKTTIWCEIAAAVSRGEVPRFFDPLGTMSNPFEDRKTVIYFSAEDDTSTVLKSRLRKAGADMHNILYLGAENEDFQKIKFVSDELVALVEKYKPILCIFDPLQSFLDDRVRMGERNAIRSRLDPLAGLASRMNTTILILMHTNKRENAFGRNRMADSSDIWDRARSVLIAGKTNQDGMFYLSHEKTNYGKLAETILYSIADDGIRFEGLSTKKDADFVREQTYTKRDAPKRDDVKKMILEQLKGGERLVEEVDDYITNAMSVSKSTLQRAKSDLKEAGEIKIWKTGNQKSENQEWWISLRGGENVK